MPVHVIPGLSSAARGPAVAGIPVTHRGVAHEFTVVSGHLPPGHPDSLVDWDALGRLRGTLLLMMAVRERCPRSPAALVGGRPRPGDPGRGRLRRVDAGRADRALHARRARRRPATGTRTPAGDHRGRRRRRRGPSRRYTSVRDRGRADRGRPTPATRGSPTTATCATSSCARTSRPSTGCSWPRARRSYAARSRPASAPRSFLMAPRWLDGLADVLTRQRRALLRRQRGAGRAGHRLPRAPRRARLARAPSAAGRRRGAGRARARSLVLEDVVDHTNVGAIFRSAARRSGSTPCCSRRAAPTRSTAARSRSAWARCSRCRGPASRTGTTPCRTCPRRGFTTVALTLADDAVAIEEAVAGAGPGRAGAGLGGPRALARAGSRRPTGARSSRWRRDRLAQRRRRRRGGLLRHRPALSRSALQPTVTGEAGQSSGSCSASRRASFWSFLRQRVDSRSPKTVPACGRSRAAGTAPAGRRRCSSPARRRGPARPPSRSPVGRSDERARAATGSPPRPRRADGPCPRAA